jgi:hypothetical protein
MNKIFYKYCFLIILLLACISCANKYDLSTPEGTFNTFYKAIEEKDIKGMTKCFFLDGEIYTEDNMKLMAKRLFNDVKNESHQIIKRENISESKVNLVFKEVSWVEGNKAKSTAKIKLKKINGEWKIYSSESLIFKAEIYETKE